MEFHTASFFYYKSPLGTNTIIFDGFGSQSYSSHMFVLQENFAKKSLEDEITT
jgi:hypothetical protein